MPKNKILIEKALKDLELHIKMRFPEAEFLDGHILNVSLSEEEHEEYSKLYEECRKELKIQTS